MSRPEIVGGRSPFAFWRIALWLILLLAAFGAMQYSVHAQRVWSVLSQAPVDADGRAALHTMLSWDVAYFLGAVALVVLCAAAILRQGWSRVPLRVALALLALGLIASASLLFHQWLAWSRMPHAALTAMQLVQESRRVHVALVFDGAGVVLLAWLVWQLGRPAVREQFRRRPLRPKAG